MRSKLQSPRIALALAGGGPMGAIYEIGALCALDEALEGLDFNRLHHYVGVSAGAFIAAALANGMTPRQLCASFIEASGDPADVFDPAWLLVPAYGEIARRAASAPVLAASALWRGVLGRRSLAHSLERLGRCLPTGLFSSEPVELRLAKAFSRPGRTNDFRQLAARLTLVATDLDSGDAAPFGQPGWDQVPISRAVRASCALPGLFPPVEIDGRHYVDGALKKTLHASVALEDGADLLLCLNPLVPFNATGRDAAAGAAPQRIAEAGMPTVLSQTLRCMIHSRMELGMKHYERAYPGSDIVLVEPDGHDAELYLANTFSYSRRAQLAEHAYQQTRAWLRSQRDALAPRLERHGIVLRSARLDAPRRLITPRPPTRIGRAVASLHDALDELGCALEAA
ncbi:patatin-like phospholipase family protein [Ramlibacter tataouinensis]|uniref:Patatin n=1 Tax=Ramlibacter tataouinensis TaxID=94132 RepID=A0A127JZS5_9BURK|nr:patatin-like phospholipase family protein [Ramlibacter tataouinensis]AMO25457.1 patatin [Ramlibacter tataouinensis]